MLLIKDLQLSRPKLERSQRAELIKEIYSLYSSETQNKLRKIENWKRYVRDCKEKGLKIKDNVNIEKYKKNRLFIKILPIKAFCFKTSHIKTPELWHVLSECKDRNNRDKSIASFLW